MSHSKTRLNPKKRAATSRTGPEPKQNSADLSGNRYRELFRGAIPASPLHLAIQEAARQEGWAPSWEQTPKRKKAGQLSGVRRGGRAELRRCIVSLARMQLSPEHRFQPYSEAALEALREQYDNILKKREDDSHPIISGMLSALSPNDRKVLKKTSDETLKADLKLIRRRRGVKRSV